MQIITQVQNQLSLFSKNLPRRPYCGDDLTYGLRVLPLQAALEKKHIQYNPPAAIHWLAFDIDRTYPGFENDWRNIAPPNIIVVNPKNQHSHYLYGLAAGVCTSQASRDAPRRLLAALYEGYRHALDADPGFAQLICKNPLNAHWNVELLRADLYDMAELSEWVDLDAADARIRKTPKKHRYGLGRNCSLFDSLRSWSYKWLADYRGSGLDRWMAAVLAKSEKLNTFNVPLPDSEIRATARSVAKWTWTRYDGKQTASSLAADGLTPETFAMMQSNLGKMGMAKRWGNNDDKRTQAMEMRSQGMNQKEIATVLDVNQGSVSRWSDSVATDKIRLSSADKRAQAIQMVGNGASQREIAEATGVAERTVRRWLSL